MMAQSWTEIWHYPTLEAVQCTPLNDSLGCFQRLAQCSAKRGAERETRGAGH